MSTRRSPSVIAERDGVRLRLVPTKGAVENLERLRDPRSGVDAGFVQAGTTDERESPDLVSLGTLFYEPLWVFRREGSAAQLLRDLPSATISVGEPGSATHPLALQLLALNHMDATNVQLRSYAPEEAARQLIAGKIDVAMMLAGWNSTAVQMLLHAPGIELMGLKRADAYVALAPKFSKLVLPQGWPTGRSPQPISH